MTGRTARHGHLLKCPGGGVQASNRRRLSAAARIPERISAESSPEQPGQVKEQACGGRVLWTCATHTLRGSPDDNRGLSGFHRTASRNVKVWGGRALVPGPIPRTPPSGRRTLAYLTPRVHGPGPRPSFQRIRAGHPRPGGIRRPARVQVSIGSRGHPIRWPNYACSEWRELRTANRSALFAVPQHRLGIPLVGVAKSSGDDNSNRAPGDCRTLTPAWSCHPPFVMRLVGAVSPPSATSFPASPCGGGTASRSRSAKSRTEPNP